MQTASRLCDYKYIIIIIIIYSYTPYVHNLKFLNVTLLQSDKSLNDFINSLTALWFQLVSSITQGNDNCWFLIPR